MWPVTIRRFCKTATTISGPSSDHSRTDRGGKREDEHQKSHDAHQLDQYRTSARPRMCCQA